MSALGALPWVSVMSRVAAADAATTAEYSAAERRLFMDDQLAKLPRNASLEYAFTKRGTLEAAIDDVATLRVGPPADGGGRPVHVDFLTDVRKIELPDLEHATGNPVILFFLERDVREMHRLTGGSTNYYRKRVRMALADGAKVQTVTAAVGERNVAATEIRIAPYIDDPARSRYERFAEKHYRFVLADDVPGKVVEMSSALETAAGDGKARETIIAESLRFARMR
jgi:hypothetical protein